MRLRIVALVFTACLSLPTFAQKSAPVLTDEQVKQLQQYVDAQFGQDFVVDQKFPPMTADFDGDGVPDVAIIAKNKNPLGGAVAHEYHVVDPYDAYFGFGNPNITTRFADFGDGSRHCVLIVHSWQAEKPRAKYAVVNLPFDRLALSAAPVKKKKMVAAISASEIGGFTSVVFFDGKKYRWEPTDFSDDNSEVDDLSSSGLPPKSR